MNDRLPHPTRKAYEHLTAVLTEAVKCLRGTLKQNSPDEVLDAIDRFVGEIHRIPSWYAELERRASFVKRTCAEGSPYDNARLKALQSYSGSPEFWPTKLELAELRMDVSRGPVLLGEITRFRGRIRSVLEDQTLSLSMESRECFTRWEEECRRIQREADRLEVDGCWYLFFAHVPVGSVAPSETETALAFLSSDIGGIHSMQSVLEAAKSLVAWKHETPETADTAPRPAGPVIRNSSSVTPQWSADANPGAPPVSGTAHDKAMISAADLASKHGVDYDALRKRLERWRRQNLDTADWKEVMNRKPRDPKYLFREAAVMAIITELRESANRARNRK